MTRDDQPTRVQVDIGGRGAWEVALPGEGGRIRCATLDEARGIAYRWAGEHRPCELVVRDAYHRVVRRDLVGAQSA